MLALAWPLSWLLLVPIVIVEARVAARVVALDRKASMMGAAIANAVSTFAGIPLTWIALVCAQLALTPAGSRIRNPKVAEVLATIVQSPWLPGENYAAWLIPAAVAILQIPFFFVSVYIEATVFRRATDCDPKLAKRWAWRANLVSYGAIIALLASLAVWFAVRHDA